MLASDAPATLVLCATLPPMTRSGGGMPTRSPRVPVTWLAPCDRLAAASSLASTQTNCEVALELPAAAFESRQRLRTLLTRGRETVANLNAVVVRGSIAAEHRSLLVEEGIRVAMVEKLGETSRGSRRPAPNGWRCRNAAWGLWEVELATIPARSPLAWLQLAGLPRPRRKSLHVIRTEGLAEGNAGAVFLASRLERWLDWASRHVSQGVAQAVTLSQLAARLSGEEQPARDHSILRAA